MSPAPADRHARIAVGALFLTNGAMFTNLVPRYPEIKASLEMSNTGFGLAVAAFPAGAMLSGLAAGALIRRFTSARVAVFSSVMIATFTFVAGLAPAAWAFALAMFLAGTADAVTDVAQNAHALRVQRSYGRSIINSLHAVWSVGAVLGGAMGSAAIALGLDIAVQLAISGAVFALMSLVSYRFLLHGPDHDEPATGPVAATDPGEQRRALAYLVLVVLAVLAIAGAVVEDAGQSWATLYLREDLGAPAAIAGFGFIALMGAQFVGRVLGDRVVDRFGERTVARCGAVLAGAGMGLALAWPTVPGTIAGFAAAGLGVATVVPAAFHAADNVRGVPPNTGLTVVTWLMRVGFLGAPPLVGAIADATSLRLGLLIVPVAGLMILLAAGVLRPKASGPRR